MKLIINQKQVKNLTFKLTGEEEITVSAPANMDITSIKKIVRVNRDKIDRLIEEDKERVTYDNPEDLSSVVRQKAQIPADVDDENLDFYRFKTVEMEYGD